MLLPDDAARKAGNDAIRTKMRFRVQGNFAKPWDDVSLC